jgi:cobyrinic acid a,c-diamide synthase
MMALSESINGISVFNLLEGKSQIQSRFQGLGTQHVELRGGVIAAHTFHYGSFSTSLTIAFNAASERGQGEPVYQCGSVTASFLHFYFPSNPLAVARLFLT